MRLRGHEEEQEDGGLVVNSTVLMCSILCVETRDPRETKKEVSGVHHERFLGLCGDLWGDRQGGLMIDGTILCIEVIYLSFFSLS